MLIKKTVPEPLSPDLVVRGEITKQLLYKSDKIEISILKFGPYATTQEYSYSDSRVGYYLAETCELLGLYEVGEKQWIRNAIGVFQRILVIREFV
ncbi:MAG: hypothetical protein K2H53_05205 [Clostridia bacterium]|nr:hypothetical protein [Clostridia bacterium]